MRTQKYAYTYAAIIAAHYVRHPEALARTQLSKTPHGHERPRRASPHAVLTLTATVHGAGSGAVAPPYIITALEGITARAVQGLPRYGAQLGLSSVMRLGLDSSLDSVSG